ncbi:hypothetical protein Tdes44962_MAKER00208 [Teratosphaeria destructans]|uniref:Uncharacterized protein n=1 Tax=Teratosphaeria destructans TaxID=418781 RepID=A0A9W7W4D3_9PEZI|nr:hypothetical protein Tdes44962_MAKER00208 [Teratosphaeria destructans]
MSKAHAIAQEYRKSDEAGEPEYHGRGFDAEYREFMVKRSLAEAPWHDDEVEQREDGPDGGEDQEVDFGGRRAVPVA